MFHIQQSLALFCVQQCTRVTALAHSLAQSIQIMNKMPKISAGRSGSQWECKVNSVLQLASHAIWVELFGPNIWNASCKRSDRQLTFAESQSEYFKLVFRNFEGGTFILLNKSPKPRIKEPKENPPLPFKNSLTMFILYFIYKRWSTLR